MARPDPITTARRVLSQRFADAELAFLAGSVVRGDETTTSDLDLVVVYGQLDRAYRKSFTLDGWPVEAFVHDPQTLRYFMEEFDRPSGVPSMPAMVSEGIALPGRSALSERLKRQAADILKAGPPPLGAEDVEKGRYFITDLADDLVAPRSAAEARATGIRLYTQLADFALRAGGHWSASGKSVPRRLSAADPGLAERFEAAFDALFVRNDPAPAIALAEFVLLPHGGRLRDGYEAFAPPHWRKE